MGLVFKPNLRVELKPFYKPCGLTIQQKSNAHQAAGSGLFRL